MRRHVAWCWTLMLLAAAFCDVATGKGGRGGARGSARGRARGAARSRPRALPRYGGVLRVAAAAAAGGAAAGAALQQAQLAGGPDDSIEYHEGNGTAGVWTSVAPGWATWGQVASWLCPLAALLHRLVA